MILKKIRRDKRGVSPVIGVILMVAATIVIAAVVIGMLGGFGAPGKTYVISVTAAQTGSDIVVTYNGGPDHFQLGKLAFSGMQGETNQSIEWDSDQGEHINTISEWDDGTNILSSVHVGDIIMASGGGTDKRDHVIVVGAFGGIEQVVLNTYV